MSDIQPSLQEYFDKARNDQPALPADEVKAAVEQQPVALQQSHNSFTKFFKKGLTMKVTAALSIALATGTTVFYMNHHISSNASNSITASIDSTSLKAPAGATITPSHQLQIIPEPWFHATDALQTASKNNMHSFIPFGGNGIDDNGNPLQGAYLVTFNIYNDSIGGRPVWSETQEVICKNGIFTTTIGKLNDLILPLDRDYWLGFSLNTMREFVPRMIIKKDEIKKDTYVEINEAGPRAAGNSSSFSNSKVDITTLQALVPIHGTQCIYLSASELANIGIQQEKDCGITYFAKEGNSTFSYTITPEGIRSDPPAKKPNILISSLEPKMVTDDIGNKRIVQFSGDDIESGNNQIQINKLIPIIVKTPCSYTPEDSIANHWRPDCIFWYKPTPEFLAALPQRFHKELVQELAESDSLIHKIQSSSFTLAESGVSPSPEKADTVTHSSATNIPANVAPETSTSVSAPKYLDLLRSVSGCIAASWIYPNPTHGECTIQYTLTESRTVTFTLHSISGGELRVLGHQSSGAGISKFNIDVHGIPPGIYLVALTTDKSEQAIQRLIVIN